MGFLVHLRQVEDPSFVEKIISLESWYFKNIVILPSRLAIINKPVSL